MLLESERIYWNWFTMSHSCPVSCGSPYQPLAGNRGELPVGNTILLNSLLFSGRFSLECASNKVDAVLFKSIICFFSRCV